MSTENASPPNSSPTPKSFWQALLTNPWFGIIGWFATVLSLFLTIYFYYEGKEAPRLTYYVNPAKAVVVQTGQASRLTTSFDNKEIKTDITAAQIAIWNRGNKPIRREQLLKPVVIYTDNNTPILEATIRKASRDVIQLAIDTGELEKGHVTVSWNILEYNDGGIIQLIYAGNPSVKIHADGVVEGQSQIEEQPSESMRQEPVGTWQDMVRWFSIGAAVAAFLILIQMIVWAYRRRVKGFSLFDTLDKFDKAMAAIAFVIFLGGIFVFVVLKPHAPPFSF